MAVLTQIASYGQTPHQLFNKKHPEKNEFKENHSLFQSFEVKKILFFFINPIKLAQ